MSSLPLLSMMTHLAVMNMGGVWYRNHFRKPFLFRWGFIQFFSHKIYTKFDWCSFFLRTGVRTTNTYLHILFKIEEKNCNQNKQSEALTLKEFFLSFFQKIYLQIFLVVLKCSLNLDVCCIHILEKKVMILYFQFSSIHTKLENFTSTHKKWWKKVGKRTSELRFQRQFKSFWLK